MSVKNLIGAKFNRLTVLSRSGSNKFRQATWNCICDCGNKLIVCGNNLNTGNTQSCGCYCLEKVTKHGNSKQPLYAVWNQMKNRCYNKNSISYHNYGGRGLKISKSWYNSFAQFVSDMGPKPSSIYTIERVNNSIGYSKYNCRWATRKEQAINRRTNKRIFYNNHNLTISEWAKKLNMPFSLIQQRLANNRPISDVLNPQKKINQYG